MRYRFIHAHQAEHRLTQLCQTLRQIKGSG